MNVVCSHICSVIAISTERNPLPIRVHRRAHSERDNASRLGVSRVDVVHDGENAADDLAQCRLVFRLVRPVRTLPDNHARNRAEDARVFEECERTAVLFAAHFLLTRLKKEDFAPPFLRARKNAVFLHKDGHIRVSRAVEKVENRIEAAAQDFAREHRAPLQPLESRVRERDERSTDRRRAEILARRVPHGAGQNLCDCPRPRKLLEEPPRIREHIFSDFRDVRQETLPVERL